MVSAVLEDGTLIETLYRPTERRTSFYIWNADEAREEPTLTIGDQQFVPYAPTNNLLRNGVVLLPSEAEEYGSDGELLRELADYIHDYIDVSPLFEKLAAYYILLSWLHDSFNELPYLRVRGDYGSGKTRFPLVVGSVCYKPIFASGASTVSPIFRILDAVRGTLILDEGDFSASDEKAELVKILNNGNARGFPVLRSEVLRSGEFDPRAYHVFGPKIVASRGFFQDRALESRFLTEELGQRSLRDSVPISLPAEQRGRAERLRNKLLLFRCRNFFRVPAPEPIADRRLEPRLRQIFAPMLSIIQEPAVQADLLALARAYQEEMTVDRAMEIEAQILQVVHDLHESGRERVTLQEITSWFADRHGEEYERRITPRWIGWHLRKRLGVRTHKSRGVFEIPLGEKPKLERLWHKYGITEAEGSPEPTDPVGLDKALLSPAASQSQSQQKGLE